MLTKILTITAAVVVGLLLAAGGYYYQTGHCPFGCDGDKAVAAPASDGTGSQVDADETSSCAGGKCCQEGGSACCEGSKSAETTQAAPGATPHGKACAQ